MTTKSKVTIKVATSVPGVKFPQIHCSGKINSKRNTQHIREKNGKREQRETTDRRTFHLKTACFVQYRIKGQNMKYYGVALTDLRSN